MRKPRCSAHPRAGALLTCKSPSAALGLWLGAAALMLTVLGAPQNSGLAGKLSTVPLQPPAPKTRSVLFVRAQLGRWWLPVCVLAARLMVCIRQGKAVVSG